MEKKNSVLVKAAIPAVIGLLVLAGCDKVQGRSSWYQTEDGYVNVSKVPVIRANGSISLSAPRTFLKKDLLGRMQEVTETNDVAVLLSGPITDKTLDAALAKLTAAPQWTVANAHGVIDLGISEVALPSLDGPANVEATQALVEAWRKTLHDILSCAK